MTDPMTALTAAVGVLAVLVSALALWSARQSDEPTGHLPLVVAAGVLGGIGLIALYTVAHGQPLDARILAVTAATFGVVAVLLP